MPKGIIGLPEQLKDLFAKFRKKDDQDDSGSVSAAELKASAKK